MRVTVADTPVVIAAHPRPAGPDSATRSYLVKNRTRTAALLLETEGAPDGDESFEWESTDPAISITLEPGEVLQGVVPGAGAAQEIHVLATGR